MSLNKKLYQIGDVIKSSPFQGYWTASVVLAFQGKSEQFSELCLIAVTNYVITEDFSYSDYAGSKVEVIDRINSSGIKVPSIYIYSAKYGRDVEILGKDTSLAPNKFDLTMKIGDGIGGWPSCGSVTKSLGSESVHKWRSVHDKENWLRDLALAEKSHADMLVRLSKKPGLTSR